MAYPAEPLVLCDEKHSDDSATEGEVWQWPKGGRAGARV